MMRKTLRGPQTLSSPSFEPPILQFNCHYIEKSHSTVTQSNNHYVSRNMILSEIDDNIMLFKIDFG